MAEPPILCTIDDVEWYWSVVGTMYRADDDGNNSTSEADLRNIDTAIARGSREVSKYLWQRYDIAIYAGSSPPTNTPSVVIDYAATFAAWYLGIRRGNSVPKNLIDLREQYIEELKEIAAGKMHLPGLAVETVDVPLLSNMSIDSRYRSRRARVDRDSSSRSQYDYGIPTAYDDKNFGGLR